VLRNLTGRLIGREEIGRGQISLSRLPIAATTSSAGALA
jgi:hypothetical protein